MGHRLTKIYTRTGDDGTTGLSDGSRVKKNSPRMQAIGAIDETNSVLGVLVAELPSQDPLATMFTTIQHDLFDLGGELSIPGAAMIDASRVGWLEEQTDLPGGNRAAAFCHLARTICRRAERELVGLAENEAVNDEGRRFLNRLSDLLFVAARTIARRDGGQEVLWQQRK